MMLSKQHIDLINNLHPLEQGFIYHPAKWLKELDSLGYTHLVKHHENKEITRATIIESFKTCFKNNNNDVVTPFLLTMIWGFNYIGYGAFRTHKYLSDSANVILLKQAYEAIDSGDVKLAYITLMQIKGLGISYATKLLYFAGRALSIEGYPLIFDNRVAKSLVHITAGNTVASMLQITPSDKWADYDAYNNLLHNWADEYNVDADQIELYLYEQKISF